MKQAIGTVPKYGDHNADVKLLQQCLRDKGFDPGLIDGWFGVKTVNALKDFQIKNGMPPSGVIPTDGGTTFQTLGLNFSPAQEIDRPDILIPHYDNFFGAPWVGSNLDLLFRGETDPELNARYVPEWKLEGLDYKTLAGNDHAWCALRVNADFRKVGIKGTNNAGASSFTKWGRKSPFWFGATFDIKHKSGGRHVCTLLYAIDESKKLYATLDGNRGNSFAVNITDLSGKLDTLVAGPRWPNEAPDGMFVSKEIVLAKYPMLQVKVGGTITT